MEARRIHDVSPFIHARLPLTAALGSNNATPSVRLLVNGQNFQPRAMKRTRQPESRECCERMLARGADDSNRVDIFAPHLREGSCGEERATRM